MKTKAKLNKLVIIILILLFIIGIICIIKGENKDRTKKLYQKISNSPYIFETNLISDERNRL